jgi:hypothetical protein
MKIINWLGPGAFLEAVVATLGYRFGFIHFRLSLLVFAIALIICSVFVVVGIIRWASSILRKEKFPLESLLLILACALIPLLTLGNLSSGGLSATMIHDITTDVDNPPAFVFIDADEGYRVNSLVYPGAKVSAKQQIAYPDITTLMVSSPPRRVFQKALFIGSLMGWELIATDLAGLRYEAVAKTRLFGFVDDIAVRITPLENGGSAIDVRSMSRVGVSDLGTNAKRIRRFLAELDAVLEQELINFQ